MTERDLKWYITQPSPVSFCGTWRSVDKKKETKTHPNKNFLPILQMVGTKKNFFFVLF